MQTNINLNERKHQLWFFINGPTILLAVCDKIVAEDEPIVCVLGKSSSDIPTGTPKYIELRTKQCTELMRRWNNERMSSTYGIGGDANVFCTVFSSDKDAPSSVPRQYHSDFIINNVAIHYRDDIADELYFGLTKLFEERTLNAPRTLILNEYELSSQLIAAYNKHGRDSWLSISRDIIKAFEVKP